MLKIKVAVKRPEIVRLEDLTHEDIDSLETEHLRNILKEVVLQQNPFTVRDFTDPFDDQESRQRKPKRFSTYHKWTPEYTAELIEKADRGNVTVQEMSRESMEYFAVKFNTVGFTEDAIRTKLHRLGYKLKNNLPYKDISC